MMQILHLVREGHGNKHMFLFVGHFSGLAEFRLTRAGFGSGRTRPDAIDIYEMT
jgi:hypothetical protein